MNDCRELSILCKQMISSLREPLELELKIIEQYKKLYKNIEYEKSILGILELINKRYTYLDLYTELSALLQESKMFYCGCDVGINGVRETIEQKIFMNKELNTKVKIIMCNLNTLFINQWD